MKASETSLRNLLGNTNIQFQVPLFQRPYSWNKDNWEILWEDLKRLYKDEIQGTYFLGSLVTQSIPGSADGICPFLIIDGQQRLTTLTIILATLKEYLQKSINQEDKELAAELYESYLVNKFKKGDDFYKILPTQDDREVYQNIIQGKLSRELKKQFKEKTIYKAYDYFYKLLKNPFPKDENVKFEFNKFKNIILEQLILVNITSEDKDNPYIIFESLNNKGQELTQADLVRNYIFMKLPKQEQTTIYEQKWLPIETTFKERIKQEEKYADLMTNFFWFYLRKDGDSVTEKEVYQTIKRKIDNPDCKIQDEIHNIIKFAKYYQCIVFEDIEEQDILKKYFKRFKKLAFSTCHIFLLNIYHEYHEKRLSLEQFKQILIYLESYFVRRWLVGISTKSLGKVFDNLYKEVKQENPDDLVEGLRRVLSNYDKTKNWPEDDDFYQSFITQTVYKKSDTARVKLILESLEESSGKKERVKTEELTIDHIMPQTLTSEWKKTLGANYNSIKKKWLHTLGNLTLTGYNSELSNKTFDEKKKIYQESNVYLNKYFQKINDWNEESIKQRAETLANTAIKLWPR